MEEVTEGEEVEQTERLKRKWAAIEIRLRREFELSRRSFKFRCQLIGGVSMTLSISGSIVLLPGTGLPDAPDLTRASLATSAGLFAAKWGLSPVPKPMDCGPLCSGVWRMRLPTVLLHSYNEAQCTMLSR